MKKAALAAVVVLAAVIAWRMRAPADRSTEATPVRRADTAATALVRLPAAPNLASETAPAAPPGALPASLEGTEPDGAVEADTTGHLIVTIELRRLFEHFLAATGEEPIDTLRARIIATLRARLPATAADEAVAILDRYLAYRDAARSLAPSDDLAAGLDQVHDLRVKLLPREVVKAFFADEEAATYAAITRRTVLADPTLSTAEFDRRLAELDAHVPPAVLEARAAAVAPIAELERETAMRRAGASDEQIAAQRRAALGSGAAARLAELDRAHAAWDTRFAKFRAARAVLLEDSSLDDATRRRRVGELFAQFFTGPEQIRVEALERIAGGSAATQH
jgi:lipase chaperone LimK